MCVMSSPALAQLHHAVQSPKHGAQDVLQAIADLGWMRCRVPDYLHKHEHTVYTNHSLHRPRSPVLTFSVNRSLDHSSTIPSISGHNLSSCLSSTSHVQAVARILSEVACGADPPFAMAAV